MGLRSSRTNITAADWRDLLDRVTALEREIGHLKVRLGTTEAAEARMEAAVEMKQIEAEVAPIETAAAAQQAEAEVKAAAARLEATTPHYPRA